MGYAVELYFDAISTTSIKEYWNTISKNGVFVSELEHNSRPHISLAVYNDHLDSKLFIKQLSKFKISKFKLSLINIGFFCTNENTIFIAPKVDKELLALHEHFHMVFNEFIKYESEYYLPKNWIPHCTINMESNADNFLKTLEIMKENYKPIEIEISKVSLIQFRPIIILFEKELQ